VVLWLISPSCTIPSSCTVIFPPCGASVSPTVHVYSYQAPLCNSGRQAGLLFVCVAWLQRRCAAVALAQACLSHQPPNRVVALLRVGWDECPGVFVLLRSGQCCVSRVPGVQQSTSWIVVYECRWGLQRRWRCDSGEGSLWGQCFAQGAVEDVWCTGMQLQMCVVSQSVRCGWQAVVCVGAGTGPVEPGAITHPELTVCWVWFDRSELR
jgi:hypothetical protein